MAQTENMDRLPKWAKSKIETLQRHVKHLEDERAAGPEDSDTFRWNGGLGEELDTPLGAGAVIRYRTGPRWDDRLDARLVRHGDHLVLDISTCNGRMAILPSDSNHVYITVDR